MGCARYIWNAKVIDDKEERLRLNSIETKVYPPVTQIYSHFKNKEETPWLFAVPSQILRNSVSNWASTYKNFFRCLKRNGKEQGRCGRPQYKKKDGKGSIHLTRELFKFEKCENGVTRLFIGTKKNNIGYLSIKNHKKYKEPNSIYIKKKHNDYWVSFCYEESSSSQTKTDTSVLKKLRKKGREYLFDHVIGIDRGIARPVQCSEKETFFAISKEEKRKKSIKQKKLKRYQKRLSRQQKGSKRRQKTKEKLSGVHGDIANMRDNFCHQVSRSHCFRKFRDKTDDKETQAQARRRWKIPTQQSKGKGRTLPKYIR